MLIISALTIVYSFCYASGGLAELGRYLDKDGTCLFDSYVRKGYNDATLVEDIQGFNDTLMYCGIAMLLLSVCLYITSCHKRRNYYITNYVATGACAGGNIVMSIVLMILNGMWMGEFNNVDFVAWADYNADGAKGFIDKNLPVPETFTHYSESTTWFILGFVVYVLVIIAAVLLILNLVWKIKLMQGEKKLLNGSATVEEGVAV